MLVSVAVHSVPGSAQRLWRAATRIIPLFVVFNTVSNVVQMLLYAAIGRLPFNGYPGSLVRFGGLWDDPNQAAMVSALVIVGAVAISRRTGSTLNRWLMAAALFNVIVSVSYSATVGLVVGLGVVVLLGRHDAAWASPDGRRRQRRRQRSAVPLPLIGLGVVVVAFMVLHPDTGVVTRAVNGKSKSAHSRLDIIEPANPTVSTAVPNPVNTLGAAMRMSLRGDGRVTSETSYIRVVLGAGLLPLFLLGAWFADTRRQSSPSSPLDHPSHSRPHGRGPLRPRPPGLPPGRAVLRRDGGGERYRLP